MNNNSNRITQLLHATRGTVTLTPERAGELSGDLLTAVTTATPQEAIMALAVYSRDLLVEAAKVLNVEKLIVQKELNTERGGFLH